MRTNKYLISRPEYNSIVNSHSNISPILLEKLLMVLDPKQTISLLNTYPLGLSAQDIIANNTSLFIDYIIPYIDLKHRSVKAQLKYSSLLHPEAQYYISQKNLDLLQFNTITLTPALINGTSFINEHNSYSIMLDTIHPISINFTNNDYLEFRKQYSINEWCSLLLSTLNIVPTGNSLIDLLSILQILMPIYENNLICLSASEYNNYYYMNSECTFTVEPSTFNNPSHLFYDNKQKKNGIISMFPSLFIKEFFVEKVIL